MKRLRLNKRFGMEMRVRRRPGQAIAHRAKAAAVGRGSGMQGR